MAGWMPVKLALKAPDMSASELNFSAGTMTEAMVMIQARQSGVMIV
jgi:hypothetical protein